MRLRREGGGIVFSLSPQRQHWGWKFLYKLYLDLTQIGFQTPQPLCKQVMEGWEKGSLLMLILSVRNSQWIFVLYCILGYVGNSVTAGIPHFENYISRPRVLLLFGCTGAVSLFAHTNESLARFEACNWVGRTNEQWAWWWGGIFREFLDRLEFWQICLGFFFRGLITVLLSSHTFLHVFLRF